jgi:hypothetical protein
MKESFQVAIIHTISSLSEVEQIHYRNQLRQLVKNEGIISICLDDKSLFVEYKPQTIGKKDIQRFLYDNEFPIKHLMEKSHADALII